MAEEEKGFTIKDRRAFDESGDLKAEETAEKPKEEGKPKEAEAPPRKEAERPPLPEVNFNSLIFSLSSSALLHLGEIADPASIIVLPKQTGLPIFPSYARSPEDPFLVAINQSGKNRGINFRLFIALIVINNNIIEQFQEFRRIPHSVKMVTQFYQHYIIGIDRVQIINQTFTQIEHLDQMRIFHRCIDFLLYFSGNQFNNFKMF